MSLLLPFAVRALVGVVVTVVHEGRLMPGRILLVRTCRIAEKHHVRLEPEPAIDVEVLTLQLLIDGLLLKLRTNQRLIVEGGVAGPGCIEQIQVGADGRRSW